MLERKVGPGPPFVFYSILYSLYTQLHLLARQYCYQAGSQSTRQWTNTHIGDILGKRKLSRNYKGVSFYSKIIFPLAILHFTECQTKTICKNKKLNNRCVYLHLRKVEITIIIQNLKLIVELRELCRQNVDTHREQISIERN